jgi:alpha-amylase
MSSVVQPLKFHEISRANGHYDLRTILDDTLTKDQPALSVPFVENHDSQPLQSLESPVDWWFKPAAYAFILLRQEGYPCVFYADWFGVKYKDKGSDGKEGELSPFGFLFLFKQALSKHISKLPSFGI